MKTIFFSFSAQTVFKNFFFFEGSVFSRFLDLLEKDENFRLVIVLPLVQVYDPFFAKFSHPRLIIEKVPFGKERTFAQRALRFFYSYFIYTGTTRIMATIGIRPDEPPAGGKFKRLLAPIKILIARTFGRSRFMREYAVPKLYFRIFKERPFARLFEKYGPVYVFLPHIYSPFDTAFLAEAKRRGVYTFGMTSNWDHFDKYYLPLKVDTLFVQSEQIRNFALRYQGYDGKKLVTVGYPHLDFMVSKAQERTRAEMLEDLNLPAGARYLLYVSGSAYCRDEPEIVNEIIRWIDENKFGKDTYLVVRPYIGTRPADRDFDKEKFDRFLGHPRVRIFGGEFWGDVKKSCRFANLLRHAAVVFVVYSTAVLEAAIFDRPLIAPTFDGRQKRPFRESIRRFEVREHFKDVLETGALKQAFNFEDMFAFTCAYLENPGNDSEKRARLLDRLCYKVDGKTSERIYKRLVDGLNM